MLSDGQRKRARQHLARLGELHDIEIHYTKTLTTSEADLLTRQVFVPKIRTVVDYMAALHEIGHLVDEIALGKPFVGAGQSRYRYVVTESAAWAWAIDEALPSLRKSMKDRDWKRIAVECWVTYLWGRYP